jgi:hypothetical protein
VGLLSRAVAALPFAALWVGCAAAAAGCTWTLQATDCGLESASLGASQTDSGEDSGQPADVDTGGTDGSADGSADGGEGGAGEGGTGEDTGTGGDTGTDTGLDTGEPAPALPRVMVSVEADVEITLCSRVEDGLDPAGDRWVYGGYFVVTEGGDWFTGRWIQRWADTDACPTLADWAPAALLDFALSPNGSAASWEPRALIVEAKPENFAMIALETVPSELFLMGEGLSEAPGASWSSPARPPPERAFWGAARDDGRQVWVNEMSLHNVIPYEGADVPTGITRRESALPFSPARLSPALEAAAASRW